MGHQGNNIHFSNDYENAVVTCTCGSVDHGIVSFTTTLPDDEYDILFFLTYGGLPYTKNLWQKICRAWDVIKGRTLYSDMYSSINEAKLLVEYLSKRIELAEQHLEQKSKQPKSSKTLEELRKEISEN